MKKGRKTMLARLLSIVCIGASLYSTPLQAMEEVKTVQSYEETEYIHNEIVVQLVDNCNEKTRKQLFEEANVKIEKNADDCYIVKALDKHDVKGAVSYLRKSSKVRLVQPNYHYQTNNTYEGTYSEGGISYSQNQWAIKNSGNEEFSDNYRFRGSTHRETVKEVAGIDVNVLPLWEEIKDKPGKKVVVAMIDSGIDITHPALVGKLWKNTEEIPGDHVDNDHNGYTDDYDGWNAYNLTTSLKDELGHGTHCAGIIAANGTNNVWGIAGKADVSIMPVKVFCDMSKNDKSTLGATSFSIRCGIKYAEKNGADICNLSLGMSQNDQLLQDTIENSNMLFVCAAGNDGSWLSTKPCYPANYTFNNVISVGNIRCDGTLHVTSNYDRDLVPVVAPGTEIYSTLPDGKYEFMTGTSMAAPFVTGIAALLYSYMPYISPAGVKNQITMNARQLSDIEGDIGYGLVDAEAAYKNDVTGPKLKGKLELYKSKGYATIKLKVKDEGLAGVKSVRWAAGNKSKAYFSGGLIGNSIQQDGTITVKKSGTYSLYAIDNSGNESCTTFKVTIPTPTRVRVQKSSVTLNRGKTYTLKPSVSPTGVYTTYTYSSSNTSVASVSSKGKITAKRRGTAVITVRTRNGKRCTCKVTVR